MPEGLKGGAETQRAKILLYPPRMENEMENTMENCMETGGIQG